MDINLYVLAGILMRIVGIFMLVTLVVPKQYVETQRPRNEFTYLRWLLFAFVVLYLTLNTFPLIYTFNERLFSSSVSDFQNITSLVANSSNLTLTIVLVLIYNYRVKNGNL